MKSAGCVLWLWKQLHGVGGVIPGEAPGSTGSKTAPGKRLLGSLWGRICRPDASCLEIVWKERREMIDILQLVGSCG